MLPLEWFLAAVILPSLLICAFLGVPHLTGQQPMGRTARRIFVRAAVVLAFSLQVWVLSSFSLPPLKITVLALVLPVVAITAPLLLAVVLDAISPRIVPSITSFFKERGGSYRHHVAVPRALPTAPPTEEKTVA